MNDETSKTDKIPKARVNFPSTVMGKFGLTKSDMLVLSNDYYPDAKPDTILLILAICKQYNMPWRHKPLEVMSFKVKNENQDKIVKGLNWWRLIAQQSKEYAGILATNFGPTVEREVEYSVHEDGRRVKKTKIISVAEWAQVTILKWINGERCEFNGPRIYWDEYGNPSSPNHRDKPTYMIEKTAEVGAYRRAFGFAEEADEIMVAEAADEIIGSLENTGISPAAATADAAAVVGHEMWPEDVPPSPPDDDDDAPWL